MNIEQFFTPIEDMQDIQQFLPYNNLDSLIEICDTFSRSNNISAYIIDYAKKGFLHVSSHPLFLCGYKQEEVKEMGYHFYEKVLSSKDLEMVLEINKIGWNFFYKIKKEDRLHARISYSFYLHHKKGGRILIHHKLLPLRLTANGNVWLAICFVSNSPHKESGNVIFTTNKKQEFYKYDFENHEFVKDTPKKLSDREIEILNLTMRGYEEREIVDLLCITPSTIKKHRQNIIKKMNVNNLSNAVAMFLSQF